MAIIYSYPHAVPTINDMVLGAKFRDDEGISTNSFYISDIIALVQGQIGTVPTLQEVTGQGANTTDQIQINGIDVATINDVPTLTSELTNDSGFLTSVPTLQQVTDQGKTITLSTSKTTLNAGQIIVENTFTLKDTKILADKITMTNANGGSKTLNILPPSGISQNRNIEFPNNTGIVALTTDIPTPAYKVYTALLTQSGTNAPVATILENTLSGTVTFEYTGPGLYNAVLVGEFTVGKTTAMLWGGTSSQLFKAAPFSYDRVLLVTYNTSGIVANDQMGITTLEIKVYN